VLIAGRRAEILRETAAELGEGCSYVAGDIRERAGAETLVHAALDRHGKLDLLLNNAGGQYFVPAEGITAKGWKAV
jgi:citronellol/citronellal dehydrogenase